MSDGRLTFEDGIITLGDDLIPGIVRRVSVNGAVKFDTAKPDGMSGDVRTPMGWKDSEIVVAMDLLSDIQMAPYEDGDTCYDKLAALDAIFKGSDNGSNPKIYTMTNSHTLARGIDEVIFCGLTSAETDRDDMLRVILQFAEFRPYSQQKESRVTLSDAAAGSSPAPVTTAKEPEADESIMADESIVVDVN